MTSFARNYFRQLMIRGHEPTFEWKMLMIMTKRSWNWSRPIVFLADGKGGHWTTTGKYCFTEASFIEGRSSTEDPVYAIYQFRFRGWRGRDTRIRSSWTSTRKEWCMTTRVSYLLKEDRVNGIFQYFFSPVLPVWLGSTCVGRTWRRQSWGGWGWSSGYNGSSRHPKSGTGLVSLMIMLSKRRLCCRHKLLC